MNLSGETVYPIAFMLNEVQNKGPDDIKFYNSMFKTLQKRKRSKFSFFRYNVDTSEK